MEKILIDNSNILMSDILNKCLLSDNCNTIRIATGYWDLLGTEMLKDSLEYFLSKKDAKLKLLIGKDPYIYYQMLSENSHLRKARYPDDFINLDLLKISKELKPKYKELVDLLIENSKYPHPKVEIKLYKKNEMDKVQFFHSKCYIFTNNDSMDYDMTAIVGSSNFTKKGLCGNSELNVVDNDPYFISYSSNVRKGHIAWFEQKWELSMDWNNGFVNILKDFRNSQSYVSENHDKIGCVNNDKSHSPIIGDNTDKNQLSKLKVVLPDGAVIQESSDSKTYIKAIIIAGIDNVRKLYPRKFSNTYQRKTSYSNTEITEGVYLWHHSNTGVKAKELKKISKKYNLNWEVIIEK